MNDTREIAAAMRVLAQEKLSGTLAETGGEDADAQAWALLVDLVESENRRRALAGEQALDAGARNDIAQQLFDLFFRLGPLQAHLDDEQIEEVIVNGPERGFAVRAGGSKEPIETGVASEEELRTLLSRVVARSGRRIDEASPAVDIRLPDGARLHAVIPPLARKTCLTIRRHRMVAEDLEDLVALGTFTREASKFLQACVEGDLNILVSGGTASGKTTTLNALGRAIPERERIVTIEETAELRLEDVLSDCIALEARAANIEGAGRVSIRELVRHALRMRPTRIIVGEVRGPEALDMLSAMNTGHEGSMGTIHANSARQALSKLRTYVLMAEEELSAEVAAEMISETIDLVVHLSLEQASGQRRCVQISEVAGLEAGRVLVNDLFRSDGGTLTRTGVRPRFADRLPEEAVVVPLTRLEDARA
jgi:pilus assembly protein CpaF